MQVIVVVGRLGIGCYVQYSSCSNLLLFDMVMSRYFTDVLFVSTKFDGGHLLVEV